MVINTPKSKKSIDPSIDISDEQINQLTKLKYLYDSDLIDEMEYKVRKKMVLG